MVEAQLLECNRETMWSLLPKHMSIAELGVFGGDYSIEILKGANPRILYLVDLWTPESRCKGLDYDTTKLYNRVLHQYGNVPNIFIWRGDSVEFLQNIGQIDCVYIDSDHGYEHTVRELNACHGVVTRYITGHDYDSTFGVPQAVNEFCEKHGYGLQLTCEPGILTGMTKSFIIEVNDGN